MLNVWLVNPFDSLPGEAFSEWRYAFLARFLSDMGYHVVWWSSTFSHLFKRQRDIHTIRSAVSEGVTVKLLDTPPYKSNISIQRLVNQRVYAKQFMKKAISFKPSPDVIIASCPPLDSAWAAIHVAHTLDAKVIIDVQDLLPEAFQLIFPPQIWHIAKWFFYPLKKWEDRIFKKSHALSAVSQDYLSRALEVQRRSKPSAVVHLGIDVQKFDRAASLSRVPVTEKGEKEFWIIYVGNLGIANDLETVLYAADLAQKEGFKNIRFLFAGTGDMLPKLQAISQMLGLENISFLGLLHHEDLVQVLLKSDVAVNAIKPESNIFFPNKVFDYFAAGLPVINSISGGELEALLKDHEIGLQYIAKDAGSLFHSIKKLYDDQKKGKPMGVHARRLAEKVFDRRIEYKKFIELINEVILI